MSNRDVRSRDDGLFLPDFCDMGTLFTVVVVGELLAFILVLSPGVSSLYWWRDLALASLFIQWVALSSAGLLCIGRRWLRPLGNVGAGVACYLLILLVSLAFSEAAYRLVVRPAMDIERFIVSGSEVVSSPGTVAMGLAFHVEFLLRNVGIAAIVSAVALRYFYIQHQWKRQLEAESRARIQALQSRIRPHFLFNSMNTIASLTRSDPLLAEQVTEDLADLFRVSLGDATIPATLERELEICRQYLRIEEQRLGARVKTHYSTENLPGDALLPGLTLQPLAENAIYHGIEPCAEGGAITISGEVDGEQLRLRISNTLPANAAGSDGNGRKSNQMAQDNVAQRLQAFFGAGAGMRVRNDGGEYVVELEFPYLRERP